MYVQREAKSSDFKGVSGKKIPSFTLHQVAWHALLKLGIIIAHSSKQSDIYFFESADRRPCLLSKVCSGTMATVVLLHFKFIF